MVEYSGTDMADCDDDTIRAAFSSALSTPQPEITVPEGPRQLYRALAEPEPYPVGALGHVLGNAAMAIQAIVQCPTACAANSVVAAAALAAQARANVELPIGDGKAAPLSLNILTSLSSGERKSTSDGYALKAIRDYERELADVEAKERAIFEREIHIFQVRVRLAEKNFKGDHVGLGKALEEIGRSPQPPLLSIIAPSGDSTMEGIFRAFERGRPDLGIFSDDGGSFLGGYSLRSEQKQATVATLCRYWDGAKVERVRGGDGVNILYDRRLACHLMVQPNIAAEFYSDRQFADQGLLARFLPSAPEETAGTRYRDDAIYHRAVEQASADLVKYNRAIAGLLRCPIRWRDDQDRARGVERDLLRFTPEARARYVEFYNEVEAQMGRDGAYAGIKPFASKMLEHASRIAGVITLIENPGASTIIAETLARGMTLARHYAGEARRIADSGTVTPELKQADGLRKWLQRWPEDVISLRQVYQLGPNSLRSKSRALPAMRILADHGWVEVIENGAIVEGKCTKEAWTIVRGEG